MPYYLNKGSKLKCSMGSEESDLELTHPAKPVHSGGQPIASIADSKPMVNIMPFGQCQSLANPAVAAATAAANGKLQKMPCVPNTAAPWLDGKTDVLVKGQPALLDSSKCMCAWAGTIEVTKALDTLCT